MYKQKIEFSKNGYLLTFTLSTLAPASSPKNISSKAGWAEARKLLWAPTSLPPLIRKVTSVGRREEGRRKWVRSPAIMLRRLSADQEASNNLQCTKTWTICFDQSDHKGYRI